jgi:hypothetical protein
MESSKYCKCSFKLMLHYVTLTPSYFSFPESSLINKVAQALWHVLHHYACTQSFSACFSSSLLSTFSSPVSLLQINFQLHFCLPGQSSPLGLQTCWGLSKRDSLSWRGPSGKDCMRGEAGVVEVRWKLYHFSL